MLDKKIEAMQTFQLTPSRRATDAPAKQLRLWSISTHALTEGDGFSLEKPRRIDAFQLTPSRRATCHGFWLLSGSYHFNSRPHGGRQELGITVEEAAKISTHALTEGDNFLCLYLPFLRNFNSRPHGGRPLVSSVLIL